MFRFKLFIKIYFFISSAIFYSQTVDIDAFELGQSGKKNVVLKSVAPLSNSLVVIESFVGPSKANNIFIEQVGDGNDVYSNITSSNSNIYLQQNGDNNKIDLSAMASIVEGNVQQIGDSNNVFSFVQYPIEGYKLNYQQLGNHTHIENFGSNSISNKMNIELKGDYRSIIIRNFQ